MSGICCLVDFSGTPADEIALRAMAESVAHRGPDGLRCRLMGRAALGHLALDTTPEAVRERQPVGDSDAAVYLVADARLDNRKELLTALGTSITEDPPTDAELIMAAYLRWGIHCPEHLLGDFAFAIWDAREGRLLCARDPAGVKPLHYSRQGDLLLVASEAQQILRHPAVPRRLDRLTVGEFLVDAVRDSDRTFFREILCLMPAHRLVATRGAVRLEAYWDVDPDRETVYRRDEEYAEHFRELLRRAVFDRMRVPDSAIGISMSGGLDSTSVAALARRPPSGVGAPRLLAVSFVFDQLERCDERIYIQAMADELGIEVEYIDAERFWILGDPVAYEPQLESPLLNWDGAYRHAFGLLRRGGARVMLNGQGGDVVARSTPRSYLDRWRRGDRVRVLLEIARYAWTLRGPKLAEAVRRHLYRPVAARVRARRQVAAEGLTESEVQASDWMNPEFFCRIRSVLRPKRVWAPYPFRGSARQKHYEDLHLLATDGQGVSWMDRCSSRYGFEARYPFLDLRLIEFVLSIPPEQLFRPGSHKSLIRRAMTGILPDVVRDRPDKSSLEAFLHWSLRKKETRRIRRLLDSPHVAAMGFVDEGRLVAAYERFRAGDWTGPVSPLWRCIQLEIWLRKYHDFFESTGNDRNPA